MIDSSEDSLILGSNLVNYNKRSSGYGLSKIDFERIPPSEFLSICGDTDAAAARDYHGNLYRLNCRDVGSQRDIRHQSWRVQYHATRRQLIPAKTAVHVDVRSNNRGAAIPVDINAAHNQQQFPAYLTATPQLRDTDSRSILVENYSNSPVTIKRKQLIAEGIPVSNIRRLSSTAVSSRISFRLKVSVAISHRY